MIVKAYISGQIAQSIYEKEDKLFILHAKDADLVRDCTPYDYSLFFSSGAEIKLFENISSEQLLEKLLKEKKCFDALHGAIGGMDKNLSEETRILSIYSAESLIKEAQISDFVKSRLFGNPIPEGADLKEAAKLSKRNNLQIMSFIYGQLKENRDVLNKIAHIFKKTIFRLSLVEDLIKINNIFITTGLFAKMFLCVGGKNQRELNKIVYDFSINNDIKNQIPLISQILSRMRNDLDDVYHFDKAVLFPHRNFMQKNIWRYDIAELLKEFQLESPEKSRESKKIKTVKDGSGKNEKVAEKIESQIKCIVKEAERRNDHSVTKFTYQLVKFNLENSREEQVCKTLCNLASKLIKIQRIDLAQEFIEYALLLNISDGYPWSIKAEILKFRREYNSAIRICDEAITKFPTDAVLRSIKIEILKACGEYEEALKYCNETIEQFPNDVVPRTVKSEILKACGEYEEALKYCNETIEQFPNDVVPRTVKSEILKARGEYEEALKYCNETIEQFPNDAVPRNVKSEILKAHREYEEALKYCNETIEQFPNDVVPRTVKSEILKARGEYEEALKYCIETIKQFPNDVVPRTVKSEILKARGEYEEALKYCNETIEQFPNDVVPRNVKSEILKARGEYEEALKYCDETIKQFPNEVVPITIKTEILKARGEYEDALKNCNETIKQFPNEVVPRNIKSEILKARGEYEEALKNCNKTIEQFPNEVVPRAIKTEILKARGKYEDALKYCNETITKFPFDPVIKNVKLTILLLMGTLNKSDFSILNKTPKTDQDYIDYHLLGMFYLKNNNIGEALRIFEHGLNNTNTYESQCYFFSALCVAKMRRNQYQETRDLILKNEDNLKISPFNRLLLVHSTAELGDTLEADRITCNITTKEAHLINLKTGLIFRYKLNCVREQSIYSNIEDLDRVIREEEEYLLLERKINLLTA